MKLLLDTHIALWAIAMPQKLPNEIVHLLESFNNDVFFSVASVWEVAIKHRLKPGQMPIPEEEFVSLCTQTGFVLLPIKIEHIFGLKTLQRPDTAPKHNDPFDRILLAQAKYEKLKLVTHDSLLLYYTDDCLLSV